MRTSFATAAGLLVVPRAAVACAVCGAGQSDASQTGFLIGTAILSVLPLLLIGSVVFWLFRRVRRLAAEEAAGAGASGQPLPIHTAPARPAAR